MAWRMNPPMADTNPERPRAWGTCDRCGFITNHHKLIWQDQYAGLQLINVGLLVCDPCYDEPQQQLMTIILPPDPDPVFNARPENYVVDETDWRVTQDGEIRETQDGALRVVQSSETEAETESTD